MPEGKPPRLSGKAVSPPWGRNFLPPESGISIINLGSITDTSTFS